MSTLDQKAIGPQSSSSSSSPSPSASTSTWSGWIAASATAFFFFFFLFLRFFFGELGCVSAALALGGGPARLSKGNPNGSSR